MAKGKYEYWLTDDGLLLLSAWARDGLTDAQIAHNMDISLATLYNYKRTYLEILEALKRNKDLVDIEVENALHKRALGYEYDEITFEHGMEIKRVTKQVAPDTTAQIFWLKNRKPLRWRDRPATEADRDDGAEGDGFIEAMLSQAINVWDNDKDGVGDEPSDA